MGTIVQRPTMPNAPKLNPLSEPAQDPSFFAFSAGPLPLSLPLHFSFPESPIEKPSPGFTFSVVSKAVDALADANPLKRRRRLTDVDGDLTSALLRKKRRLRLNLITSRLSQPFSHPATNIVDRGRNKAAIWARVRNTRNSFIAASFRAGARRTPDGALLGRVGMPEPVLRKAAVLNRMRLRGLRGGSSDDEDDGANVAAAPKPVISDAEAGPLKSQLRSQEPDAAPDTVDEPFVEATHERIESPNMMASKLQPYTPLAPSPLGMTNYDALDLEDDYPHDDVGDDDDDGHDASVWPDERGPRRDSFYSDFSVFDIAFGDKDDDDDGDVGFLGFSGIPSYPV